MLIEAEAEPVNEGDRADVQGRLGRIFRTMLASLLRFAARMPSTSWMKLNNALMRMRSN